MVTIFYWFFLWNYCFLPITSAFSTIRFIPQPYFIVSACEATYILLLYLLQFVVLLSTGAQESPPRI